MTAFDRSTLAFYESQAEAYLAQRPCEVSEELPPFLDLLPPRASILEVGCGGGADAAFMIARGFAVEPTDGVAAMACEAQARLNIPVRLMRFDELAVDGKYDAIVALASLLHAPRDELLSVVARIWRALKPGGHHLATFKTAGLPGHDEHGRYYNYPSRADAETIYRTAGDWRALDFAEHDGVGYFSSPARWLTVTAQKSA